MTMQPIRSLVLPALLGVLLGIVRPAGAAETLCGGYTEASVTNTEVVAAAQFAVKALAAMPERTPVITLVEILSASQQVVAGMNYRLRLKVKVDGKDRDVEIVVWRKLDGEHEQQAGRQERDKDNEDRRNHPQGCQCRLGCHRASVAGVHGLPSGS